MIEVPAGLHRNLRLRGDARDEPPHDEAIQESDIMKLCQWEYIEEDLGR